MNRDDIEEMYGGQPTSPQAPSWRSEPATPAQRKAIRRFGGTTTRKMTKGDASDLIEYLKRVRGLS